MMKRGFLGAVLAVALWSWLAVAATPPARAATAVRRDANLIRVDERPALLLWAEGLEGPADLADYQAAGMNTVYIRISQASAEQLAVARSLAEAAGRQGLFVVVALAPSGLTDAEGAILAVEAASDSYVQAVQEFAEAVVRGMGDSRAIIGWSVEAVPPGAVVWDDDRFRLHLQNPKWYPSLAALNQSWGSELNGWGDVTLLGVREIDSTFPGGLGRASIDLAYYREEIFADALSVWAAALRANDSQRLVLASGLSDYRSIISVRTDFDGLIVRTYPSLAEWDRDTHNVHAVDIARRANQFAAIQVVEVEPRTPASQVSAWANLAALHGAAGIAFTSWPAIRDSAALREGTAAVARGLTSGGSPFPLQPLARTAILYEPIAGGAMRDGRGLYGYLDGVAPNEPTALFVNARNGSRFGQIDVLSLASLEEVDLTAYGAILAPMALYLPESAQFALQNYVQRGGALVVDAGVGMYQAEGTIASAPPVIRDMLGMRRTDLSAPDPWREQGLQGDLGGPGEPGSPGVEGELGEPGVAISMSPARRGLTTNPELQEFADILDEFLSRTEVTTQLGSSFTEGDGPRVRLRELGRGVAVYVPVFLYEDWDRSDPRFDELHWQILSRGIDLEVITPEGLWPPASVATYQGWPIAVASLNGRPVVVDAFDADNQMYVVPGGAMRLANPNEDNRIELVFPGDPMTVATPVPVFVRPGSSGDIVSASIVRYDANGIELQVHGGGSQVNRGPDGLQIQGGVSTPVEIEIRSGEYAISAGSMHHLVIADGLRGGRAVDQVIMPDPETGSLTIRTNVARARVRLGRADEE